MELLETIFGLEMVVHGWQKKTHTLGMGVVHKVVEVHLRAADVQDDQILMVDIVANKELYVASGGGSIQVAGAGCECKGDLDKVVMVALKEDKGAFVLEELLVGIHDSILAEHAANVLPFA
mmetsp:Transcript_291/g.403  ORF Transcript_291/g.403 Transcript_291/m.403 type:complete len:121 (-) Transcript_291:419-781(-)